jgi:hypothetical protein
MPGQANDDVSPTERRERAGAVATIGGIRSRRRQTGRIIKCRVEVDGRRELMRGWTVQTCVPDTDVQGPTRLRDANYGVGSLD